MDLGLMAGVTKDVTMLMDPQDEEEWHRIGLFSRAGTPSGPSSFNTPSLPCPVVSKVTKSSQPHHLVVVLLLLPLFQRSWRIIIGLVIKLEQWVEGLIPPY